MELSPARKDALLEVLNIGMGQAARVLNDMLGSHVLLSVPNIEVYGTDEFQNCCDSQEKGEFASVEMKFGGSFDGSACLVFPSDSAVKLVSVLTDDNDALGDNLELDDMRIGALTEVGNIVINGVMGSLGNVLESRLNYMVPIFREGEIRELLRQSLPDGESAVLLVLQSRFTIEEHEVQGDLIILFRVGAFNLLIEALDRSAGVPSA